MLTEARAPRELKRRMSTEKRCAADRKRKGRKKGPGADTHEDTDDEDEGAGAILKDDRFARMFEDADFEVDEDDDAYRVLHPNAPKLSKREREEMLEEHFDLDD